MKNQFFYTRKELVSGTPDNPEFKEYRDSFNVDKIIRTITVDDGRLLVLLDDIHQRPQETEMKNKQGRVTSMKREMNVFQTEIYLDPADVERFVATVKC